MAVQNNLSLLLRNSLEFLSSLNGRSWHSNPKLLQQVTGIGQVSSNSLFNAGIRSIDAIRSAEDHRLEILLKRNPPFGRNIKKIIAESFPSIKFDCELKDGIIKMELESLSTETSFQNKQIHLLVIAYENSSICRTLLYNQIPLNLLTSPLNRTIKLTGNESSYSCSIMFENWSGLNQNICFDIPKSQPECTKVNVKVKEIELLKSDDIPSDFDFDENDIYSDICTPKTLNLNSATSHPIIPLSPLSTKSQVSPSPPSCKHPCKDKFSCAHVCCKAGLFKRPAEAVLTTPLSIKRPSFLSGAKRSLSNAREYLRKYQPINISNNIVSNLQPTAKESDLYDEIELALR